MERPTASRELSAENEIKEQENFKPVTSDGTERFINAPIGMSANPLFHCFLSPQSVIFRV